MRAFLTCSHVNENTLPGPEIGHLKQHHVGRQVVNRKSGSLLKTHLLWHGESPLSGNHNHFLPHATAAHCNNTISHLNEQRRGDGEDEEAGYCGQVLLSSSVTVKLQEIMQLTKTKMHAVIPDARQT